jgi:alkylmercury lyase
MHDVKTMTDPVESGLDTADPLIREVVANTSTARLTNAAFDAILDGKAPQLDDLVRASAASAGDVDELLGCGVIVDDTGHVVAAHGLSLVPARQHRLTLRGRQFWTWCAIDAIGIPAGLGEDAIAETTCHQCGTPIRLEFRAGVVVNTSHPAAQAWNAQRLSGASEAGPLHCALMNLFCSPEHLAEWHAAHSSEQGRPMDLRGVSELGRTEWGRPLTACGCEPGAQQECCR